MGVHLPLNTVIQNNQDCYEDTQDPEHDPDCDGGPESTGEDQAKEDAGQGGPLPGEERPLASYWMHPLRRNNARCKLGKSGRTLNIKWIYDHSHGGGGGCYSFWERCCRW